MSSDRAAGLALTLLALAGWASVGSCKDDDPGSAEGGIVRRIGAGDALGAGPERAARPGDLVLDNGVVRFVVQDPASSTGWSLYGGSLVDLGAARAEGPTPDLFEELFVQCDLRAFRPRRAEIVAAGGPEQAGVLRLVGEDAGIPYLDAILPRDPLDVTITVELTLPPSGRTLEIAIAAKDERKRERRELSCGLVLLPGDAYRLYTPRGGFVDQISGRLGAYVAAQGRDGAASYALSRADGEGLEVILPGLPFVPLGPPAEPFLANATLRTGYRLTVGEDEGVASALRAAGFAPDGARPVTVRVSGLEHLDAPSLVVRAADGAPVSASAARADGEGRFLLDLGPGAYEGALFARDHADALARFPFDVPPGADPVTVDAPPLELGTLTVRAFELGLEGVARGPTPARIRILEGAGARVDAAAVYEAYAPAEHTLRLPPGAYTLVVSRGPEHELFVEDLDVTADALERRADLRRVVDRGGWVSADLHVHGTRSTDSEVSKRARVLGAAAEGLDVLVSSDHDAVTDYRGTVEALGLQDILRTTSGAEISPLYGHINGFPIAPTDPEDHWRPGWFVYGEDGRFERVLDPHEVVEALRAEGAQVVQLNHPRGSQSLFGYIGLDPATGAFDKPWPEADAIELLNGKRLDDYPEVLADLQGLLRSGRRIAVTGTSDVHDAFGVGYARTYVRVPDAPSLPELDLAEIWAGLRAGRAVAASGPFVELSVAQGGARAEPGEVLEAGGAVEVSVRVQAPSWMTPTRLRLFDGAEVFGDLEIRPEDADPARPALRLSRTFTATVSADTYFMAEVTGVGGRPWLREVLTVTNPAFVDADGGGLDLSGR